MKAIILFIFFTILTVPTVFGQIKIGDNPQNIDPTSVLELESTSKVLVITRVSTLEMEAITPQRGGMVYNTDTECINYYDGTQWINLCDAVNFTITNDPIINGRSTIEITESTGGYNLEVAKNSILGDNIIDGGIGPDDIQDNSITQDKLAAESVGSSELRQNSVGTEEIRDGSIAPADIANFLPGQVLTTDENGIVQWQDSDELYDLTFNKLDNTLTISRSTTAGVSTIDLAALVGSDDQILTLTDNTLSLENDPNDIDLSTYLQQLSINAAGDEISLTNGGTITLPNPTIDTDEQNLGTTTLANEILTITIENGDPTTADLTPFATDAVVTAGLVLKENIANKSNDVTLGNSTDLYPTQNAVKTYVDNTVGGSAQTIVSADPNNSIFQSVNDGGAFYNDGDGDSQNELQNINFDTNTNILTISTPLTTGNEVDLSSLADATVVDGTETVLEGGIKIGISGNGSSADPYVINASEDIALDNGKILIGNPIGEASEAFVNGDATMNNEGLLTINPGVVTPAKIMPAPGVLTEDQVLITTIAGDVEWADFPPGGGGDDDQNASEVDYDNTNSGLAAITTQAAIDELAASGLVDTDEQKVDEFLFGTANLLSISLENDGEVPLTVNLSDLEESADILANTMLINTHITNDGDTDDQNEIELPDDTAATAGDILSTDAAGNYSWITPSLTNTDEQTVDEFILGTGNLLSLSLENDGEIPLTVDLSDLEESADILANTTLINTHITNDGDTDDQNEIELPDDTAATAGDILSTDAAGNYSWITPSLTNTDEQTVDEFILGTGNLLSLSLENDGEIPLTVDLSDLEESADILANTTLINTHITNDGDTDDQNEIELPDDSAATAGDILSTDAAGNYSWISNNSLTGTTGSLFFADDITGAPTENNLQLKWNEGNNRLAIGNISPQDKLDVDGQIRARNGFASTEGSAGNPGYGFYTNNDTNIGMFRVRDDVLAFSTNGQERLRIIENGDVGIGTETPLANLHVAGDVRADGGFISADQTIDIPDYVFQKYFLGNSILNPNYEFNDLTEIEAFVKENNHLPGIQSAQAVKEQGFWNVSESSRVNLEKIEELFLHTIEQEKKIKELKAANTNMQTEMEALKAQMEEIKSMLLEKENN
ncbi:hypothetical protein [Maribacter stanieri]|uniref:hypothetical protein n=1 Tax=Maribacter stanieri TaxID=440514 RepID=UPI002494F723|nr:hypothetical protein [Maribacter stanieri]